MGPSTDKGIDENNYVLGNTPSTCAPGSPLHDITLVSETNDDLVALIAIPPFPPLSNVVGDQGGATD
eukprot:5864175-Prorocentrum_lima.AAC.1